MESYEVRKQRKDQEVRDAEAAWIRKKNERAAIEEEEEARYQMVVEKIESLKRDQKKHEAHIETHPNRIRQSKDLLETDIQKAREAHDYHVRLHSKTLEDAKDKLLRVKEEIEKKEKEVTNGAASSAADSAHGDNNLGTASHADDTASKTAHEAAADEHGPRSITDTQRKAPSGSIQRTPVAAAAAAAAVMQPSKIPSPAGSSTRKDTPGKSVRSQTLKDGGDLTNIDALTEVKLRASLAEEITTDAESDGSYDNEPAGATLYEKWPVIHKHTDEEYYELGCQIPSCRHNASGKGFFKGLGGLKRHFRYQHKASGREFHLEKSFVHKFDDHDQALLRDGKDPVNRVPKVIAARVSGAPTKNDASASDSDPDDVLRGHRRKSRPDTAIGIRSPKVSRPSATPVAPSTAKVPPGRTERVATPKQPPSIPTSETAQTKSPDFTKSGDVAQLLASGGGQIGRPAQRMMPPQLTTPRGPQVEQSMQRPTFATAAKSNREPIPKTPATAVAAPKATMRSVVEGSNPSPSAKTSATAVAAPKAIMGSVVEVPDPTPSAPSDPRLRHRQTQSTTPSGSRNPHDSLAPSHSTSRGTPSGQVHRNEIPRPPPAGSLQPRPPHEPLTQSQYGAHPSARRSSNIQNGGEGARRGRGDLYRPPNRRNESMRARERNPAAPTEDSTARNGRRNDRFSPNGSYVLQVPGHEASR